MIPGYYPTLLGGKMLGHHIEFQPSAGGYAGFYGAADTGRYWKITRDGIVWFKQSTPLGPQYMRAYDAGRDEKIIVGDPGGFLNVLNPLATLSRDVRRESEKQELEATTVDSRRTYPEAEARAKEIVAAGAAALQAASANLVAPAIAASSGSELVAAYEERDRAQTDAAIVAKDPKRKKRKKRLAKKAGVPTWVIVAASLAGVGLLALALRRRTQ